MNKNQQGSGASVKPTRASKEHLRQLMQDGYNRTMRKFPTSSSLGDFYNPKNWGLCLTYQSQILTEPCIYLCDVDKAYGKGSATNIVQKQYIGQYQLSTVKEPFSEETASVAASLFVATYGDKCTLNLMMLYFGRYMTHYKGSYYQFDSTDILRQYGAKFLPWYQSQTTEEEQQEQPQRTHAPRGLEARDIYIKDCIRNGIEVRDGGLYRFGFVTEWELQHLEQEVGK